MGSFTNIRGGHAYAPLIRKTPPKPLRVFLQDGAKDLDNEVGNWPLANQQMAASLKYAKYDYKFVFGEGIHSGIHGGAILPDSMRWLMNLNPAYYLVEAFRAPVYAGLPPEPMTLIAGTVAAVGVLALGWFWFTSAADDLAARA